jgi:hydroxymethylpyrimidine pyrophosphatase-like HAD family hydrolase
VSEKLARRPKLIASDLDGTVVAHYGSITQRTIDAFRKAHSLGVEIYFVTGRPPRWMPEIKEAFGIGNAICGNGAMLYDLHNDKVLEEWLLPIDAQLEAVLARCSQQEFSSDEMLAIAKKELEGIVTVTHSNPADSLLEISAIGVSKGATLSKMAARHGLDADDCVSFGDNPNDFSMLEWCGRSFAMADGHPDGPKYAKGVAGPCEEDGVAIVIEQLLELPA